MNRHISKIQKAREATALTGHLRHERLVRDVQLLVCNVLRRLAARPRQRRVQVDEHVEQRPEVVAASLGGYGRYALQSRRGRAAALTCSSFWCMVGDAYLIVPRKSSLLRALRGIHVVRGGSGLYAYCLQDATRATPDASRLLLTAPVQSR